MNFSVRLQKNNNTLEELSATLWSDVLNTKGRKSMSLGIKRIDEDRVRLELDDVETLKSNYKMNMGLLEVSTGE